MILSNKKQTKIIEHTFISDLAYFSFNRLYKWQYIWTQTCDKEEIVGLDPLSLMAQLKNFGKNTSVIQCNVFLSSIVWFDGMARRNSNQSSTKLTP